MEEKKEYEVSIYTTFMSEKLRDSFYRIIGLDFSNESGMEFVSYSINQYTEEVKKIFSKGTKKGHKGYNFKIRVIGTHEQLEKLKLLITGFHIYRKNIIIN